MPRAPAAAAAGGFEGRGMHVAPCTLSTRLDDLIADIFGGGRPNCSASIAFASPLALALPLCDGEPCAARLFWLLHDAARGRRRRERPLARARELPGLYTFCVSLGGAVRCADYSPPDRASALARALNYLAAQLMWRSGAAGPLAVAAAFNALAAALGAWRARGWYPREGAAYLRSVPWHAVRPELLAL
jgi:hypothetical protein